MDYKEWIANRADELSQEMFDRDFYSNGPAMQLMLWARAEQDYNDYYAARIDAAYDNAKDRQLLGDYLYDKNLEG